jgi:hypothetical protein
MPDACSGTQASDRFGITLDFVTKLHNGTISDDEAKRFLRREDPFAQPKAAAPSVKATALLSVSATTELVAVAGKPTKKCFTGSRYAYRDSDFDGWLPKEQPEAAACTIATLTPSRDATFAQWAAFVLGVPADTSIEKLAALLKERGHTMTLSQAEAMVEATESKSGNTGMRTDGWANWFFVEDKNGSVSVAHVSRGDSRWLARVRRLGNDRRWRADFRLLVRNLDASKLGS